MMFRPSLFVLAFLFAFPVENRLIAGPVRRVLDRHAQRVQQRYDRRHIRHSAEPPKAQHVTPDHKKMPRHIDCPDGKCPAKK